MDYRIFNLRMRSFFYMRIHAEREVGGGWKEIGFNAQSSMTVISG